VFALKRALRGHRHYFHDITIGEFTFIDKEFINKYKALTVTNIKKEVNISFVANTITEHYK